MKKINLIERLWTDSHEKQSPQRFARYAVMLMMLLTLGVGQMWAYVIIRNAELAGSTGAWSNSETMTQVGSTNVYYKTYNSPTATTDLIFRIGTGSGWTTAKGDAGIDNKNSNIVMVATGSDQNIKFQVPTSVPVTIYYNNSTNKIWIKVASYKTDVLDGKEMFYYGFTNNWSETMAYFYDNGTKKFGSYAANSYADNSAKLAIGVYDVNSSTKYSASNNSSWKGIEHTGMAGGDQIQTYNDGGDKCYHNAADQFSFGTTAYTIVVGQTIASFPTISFTSKQSGADADLSLEGYYYSTATSGQTWTAFTPGTTESSLAAGTYYIKALATDGAIYMASSNYITLTVNSAPVLGVANATSVSNNSATFNATVTLNSNTTTSYGFKYGAGSSYDTKAELVSGGTSASTSGALAGTSFSKDVTGLSASTTYYYISYAVVNGTTYYSSSVKSFTTSANPTYSLTVSAGTGISDVTGSTDDISAGDEIAITATVATGYTWDRWTKTGSGTLSTFTATTKNQTVVVGTAANMTLTASATENKSTVTVTANNTSAGSLKYGETSKSWGQTPSLGVSTSQAITATANTGYVFCNWSLSGAAASASDLTSATITLKADGSGNTGTATAMFYEDYYYRGEKNSNSATLMTCHESGYYAYFSTSGTHKFKCAASTSTWDYNTYDNSYGNIILRDANDGYGNVYCPESGSHYIMIFYPNTAVNSENYPVIAAGTALFDPSKAILTLTSPSTSTTSLYCANNPMTIGVSATNLDGKTSLTYSYEYSEDKSSWSTITPTSSSSDGGTASCVWTTPNVPANKTYYVRAKLTYTYEAATVSVYSGASAAIKVTGTSVTTKTIKVKKPAEWDSFEGIHIWSSGDGDFNTSWPGFSIIVNHLGGSWYEFVIPSVCNNFVLNNGITEGSSNPDKYQTVDLTFSSSITDDNCYVLDNKTDASDGKYSPQKTYKYNLTHTDDCPETPTVSASAATNVTNVSATLNGRISDDGNDAITEYGFYWGTTSACANKQVKGTSFTPDNTYTHNLTGLTAGNTIYFKAFAKNGLGETVTTPATSFTVPYKVTITQPTGCSTITPGTGTQYVSVGDNIVATAATGYTFSSWSATNVTLGTPSTVTGVTTSAITAISADNGTIEPVYTANTYTVDFDVNGGTASTPDDKEVTFGSAYGTLPSGMTHTSKTFIGWYTNPDDGEGDHITAETIVSTASDHTLYAHYENVYSVNVNFKSGTATIYPATSVTASPTSLAPTITAPEIFGYTFTGWTGSNATFGNASSATTTVNATAATTVTANYNVVPTVYFKNNLGWDSVFVTFDCGFNSSKENVPSNNDKAYYKMTQIGATDVFYCEIPASYISSWTGKIAFDNTNYGGTGSTTHVGTWNAFFGGECAGRGDFDANATLYIPYSGESQSRNSTKFYQTGCWMKYNSTESGYQVNMNTLVTGSNADSCVVKLTAANAGGYEFSAKIKLHRANYTYGFKLYKIYNSITGDLWYTNTGTIYASTDDLPWHFWSGSSITATSQRCGLHTEALGDYTITVSFATGRPMVNVEYPASVGDWRLAYNDRVAWSGSTHDASWYIYSRVIKAKADAEDIVSFYVSKADGANAHIELQKCTAINPSTGAETWTKQGSNLDISAITGTGIYNFKVTQNGSKVASATYLGGYEGNFYIRTDASDGGWNNYISSGKNLMTYSEYAEDNSGFTHYYMRYVTTGSNIKFCIANDYSECLTEYCVSDDFTNEYIEANGNVRFMWDHRTNKVSRAYISGSTVVSDRFLVLEGDAKMFDENGNALSIAGLNANEMKFTDDQNWIYEATVKAQPGARIKLTAKYNNKIQYFYGDEGARTDETTELLIGGSGTNKYKVRVVYDFKTNRLIKAFIPDGDIGTTLAIDADLMIIREHQDEAQQITFTESGKLTDVKTVYGAMKFNKYTVNGKEKTGGHASTGASRYERDLFYISFPFDVKLSDVFGFGTYGKHWIIEYYDGKGRAKNGFWADSEPNWKFVWPAQRSSFTMKAFEGYILALDLDEMTESSSVWNNNVEDVYIYFPSDGDVGGISATSRTVDIDQDGYQCTIGPRFAGGDDRRQKDSYWHCIGVPSFANYSSDLTPTSEDATTIDWRTGSLPYLYEWNSSNNTVSVTSSATFSFKATYSYLVQYSGDHIYWSSVNTPSSIVARERTAPKNAEFRIELQKAGEKADQTFVRLTQDENVTAGYDFNYDLSKEFNKNQANIYTMVTTLMDDGPSITEVAGNVQPMSEQTTVIPMGVKIAADGDYTFAIPDGTEGIGVTLIDNETGIRTSLSALDYTINLSAGTYENRFVLEISPIKQMPTGVEEVTGDGLQVTGVRKVMIDGILYIVKDGKVFDAHGNRVK